MKTVERREEINDSLLLTRENMLKLKAEKVIFKPRVPVGVAEGDATYKALK